MSHLCAYVEDATGQKYLFQTSADTDEHRANFRKHAGWWIKTGYKSAPRGKGPAMPCRVVFEPFTPEC